MLPLERTGAFALTCVAILLVVALATDLLVVGPALTTKPGR
jgi:hypothetical protein